MTTDFETEFPSLIGKIDSGELKCDDGNTVIADWVWLHMVERNCLDRERVKQAIQKLKENAEKYKKINSALHKRQEHNKIRDEGIYHGKEYACAFIIKELGLEDTP